MLIISLYSYMDVTSISLRNKEKKWECEERNATEWTTAAEIMIFCLNPSALVLKVKVERTYFKTVTNNPHTIMVLGSL